MIYKLAYHCFTNYCSCPALMFVVGSKMFVQLRLQTQNSIKLSLGDARAHYLSNDKNELGVVSAQSIAGKLYVATELGIVKFALVDFSIWPRLLRWEGVNLLLMLQNGMQVIHGVYAYQKELVFANYLRQVAVSQKSCVA